jgi:hypothetical protein
MLVVAIKTEAAPREAMDNSLVKTGCSAVRNIMTPSK